MKSWASLIASFTLGILVSAVFFKRQISAPAPLPPLAPQCTTPAPAQDCLPSNSREPVVYSHDILPPPHFRSDSPPTFVTNREGEVHVAWAGVKGAKSYRIFLVDSAGKVMKTYSSSKTSLYLKDIPLPQNAEEANYEIQLASLNADNLEGQRGEKRDLKVARQADVMAPTVKNIVIED